MNALAVLEILASFPKLVETLLNAASPEVRQKTADRVLNGWLFWQELAENLFRGLTPEETAKLFKTGRREDR